MGDGKVQEGGGGERMSKEDVGEWERGRRKENMGESESVW